MNRRHGITPGSSLIYLVGFMGSGKTTVGKALSGRLGIPFVDLDDEIERREGVAIREIFRDRGEEYFRRVEREELTNLGRDNRRRVVALGGGAFCREENRRIVRESGISIWLDVPIDLVLARCSRDDTRPLLTNRSQVEHLMESRRPSYALADLWVNGAAPVEAVVADILGQLGCD